MSLAMRTKCVIAPRSSRTADIASRQGLRLPSASSSAISPDHGCPPASRRRSATVATPPIGSKPQALAGRPAHCSAV